MRLRRRGAIAAATGVAPPAAAEAGAASARGAQRMTLVAACVAFFMVVLATTALNVALRRIGADLGAGLSGLQWVVNGYTLVFASLLLTAGALGDRLGHNRTFGAGFAIFATASALCAAAPTLRVLIACQALAGLGAALLVPASLALLSQVHTSPAERARAIGLWAAAGGAAIAAGPLIGGLLVDALGWRSIFAVNVLAGVAGLVLTVRFVAPVVGVARRGLDLAGQIVGIVALGALSVALIEGGARGWGSALVRGAFGLFAVATPLFLVVEGRGASPMLPLSLFRSPTFSTAAGVGFLTNFAYYGQVFLLSLFFTEVRGYSPLVTGLAFLPMSLSVPLANVLVGRLLARLGPRAPMALGQALGGAGLLALVPVDAATPYPALVVPLFAVGIGGGLTVPPMTAALLAAVPAERRGLASGVLNASRQGGGAIGVALFGALVGRSAGFVDGMHLALLIAGGAVLVGCVATLRSIPPGPRP